MRMRGVGARVVAVALAGGAIAAAQVPAFASPRQAPTVSISAKSGFKPVSGHVFVAYKAAPKDADVTIKGTIANATSGQVAELFANQFPYKSGFKQVGSAITLNTTGTDPYSFRAIPQIATRYKVELLATTSSTTPLATSPVTTVYVASDARLVHHNTCTSALCHLTLKFKVLVPALALRTEIKKTIYPYFAQARSGVPAYVYLRAGNARVGASRKVAANAFTVSVTWTFQVANGVPFPTICSKDTESVDGVGLPGHHGCGARRISTKQVYVG